MKNYGANKTLDIPHGVNLQRLFDTLGMRDKRTRRIVNRLIRTQQTWFENESRQGLQRSKDLCFLWKRWVASGCRRDAIPPLVSKHSLLGRLTNAMRLVSSNPSDLGLINLITSALRYHEILGISDAELQDAGSEVPSTITDPNPYERAMAFGLWHATSLEYGSAKTSDDELRAYKSARALREAMHLVMPLGKPLCGDYEPLKHMRGCKPRIAAEEVELLRKAGPHKFTDPDICPDGVRLKSIIGEPLDVYALESSCVVKQHIEVRDHGLTTRRRAEPRTLYEVTNSISRTLLRNPYIGERGLVHASANPGLPVPPGFEPRQGALNPIKDKAGKIRWIATTNYTVNKALGPYHRWLYEILSHFPCDCTDQRKGIARMCQMTSQHEPCVSTDLSSATDRLPLIVQRYVLEHLLQYAAGYTFTEAFSLARDWYELLSSLNFEAPDGTLVRYGAGQPMGVYTSWVMLAITHHIVTIASKWWQIKDNHSVTVIQPSLDNNYVYKAYTRSGDLKNSLRVAQNELKEFIDHRYIITGDDNTIFDSTVRPYYAEMMTSFGVDINLSKSIFTDAGAQFSAAEFCKKMAVNGDIISGQSLKVVARGLGLDDGYKPSPMLAPSVVKTLMSINQGRTLPRATISWIASSYPRKLHHIPLEFGGLGVPLQGSTLYECLASDGYVIYYIAHQLKLMTKTWSRSELIMHGQHDTLGTFEGQLSLFDSIKDCSVYPRNDYRKFDNDLRYLYQTEQFVDRSPDKNLRDRIEHCQFMLHQATITGDLPSYTDFIDIVDTWLIAKRDFIKTRFTPGLRDPSGFAVEASKFDAYAAFPTVKDCRKESNHWRHDMLDTPEQGVLVDLAEAAYLLVRE